MTNDASGRKYGSVEETLRGRFARGEISAEEYEILPTYFRRTGYYLHLILSGHLPTWRRVRKVHGAAVDLAFTKRLARNAHTSPQSERIGNLRRRIYELRGPAPQAAHP